MTIIKCCKCLKDINKTEFSMFHGRLNRTCNKCRSYHNNFYKNNSGGYRDRRKTYYLENKKSHAKRAFRNNLRRKYRMSLDDYNRMMKNQGGNCAICDFTFYSDSNKWNRPCIDHSHKTGEVRGILCRKCNLNLYWLENLVMFDKAIRYLGLKDVVNKELLR